MQENPHPHTSEILQSLMEECQSRQEAEISLGEFAAHLQERGLALVIFIFSLPNCLPFAGVTGITAVVSVPIVFFSLQLLLGRKKIWLPERLRQKRFQASTFTATLEKLLPKIRWLERYLHPRLPLFTGKAMRALIALICIVLSILIALPIPGANFLPGLVMTFLLLALLERDGLIVLLSLLLVAICCYVLGDAISRFIAFI